MARDVTGIGNAHKYLDEIFERKAYFDRLEAEDIELSHQATKRNLAISRPEQKGKVRRVKIVHIDYCWNIEHPMFPFGIVFGSEKNREINQQRISKNENTNLKNHGTACVAAIRTNEDEATNPDFPLDDEQAKLWNLANFCDIVLIPLNDPRTPATQSEIDRCFLEYTELIGLKKPYAAELLRCLSEFDPRIPHQNLSEPQKKSLDLYKLSVSELQSAGPILDALDEVIELGENGLLERGDIVSMTICARYRDAQGRKYQLPTIHHPWIESKVTEITNRLGISVIMPAGNSGLDLDTVNFDRLAVNPLKTSGRDQSSKALYDNHGTSCGAILVGAQKGNVIHCANKNFGSCIDAFGRAQITVPPLEDLGIDQSLYAHWQGSSIAAMVAAAVLANIQQIRFASDTSIQPLKPYEARAHLRQWASRKMDEFECRDDLMGPPPDIETWLAGTKVV